MRKLLAVVFSGLLLAGCGLRPGSGGPEGEESVEGYHTSDVDVEIPTAATPRPDAVGVVIGITEYANPDLPAVDFARRDARLMRDYLVQAMGFREENIIMAVDQDATKETFNRIFEVQLQNYIKPGESDVFVYYSGRGAPDFESTSGYFIPYDTDPSYMARTGYSQEQFYRQLNKLEARSVTVVVESSFAAATNLKNGVVLTSSAGDQISSWYPEQKHSLYTYYFLKGLQGAADQDGDRSLTVGELQAYLEEQVPYMARRMFNREQTPQLMGETFDQILVEY
jgi:uncharacterized caspase-like protein